MVNDGGKMIRVETPGGIVVIVDVTVPNIGVMIELEDVKDANPVSLSSTPCSSQACYSN